MRASSNASNPHSYGESFSGSGRFGETKRPTPSSSNPTPTPTRMNSRMGKYCSSMIGSIPRFGRPKPRASVFPLYACPPAASIRGIVPNPGADGETRTHTANATAPSRQRVYQFHHVGYFGTSPGFDSGAFTGAPGAGAAPCGTSAGLLSLSSFAA